MPSLVPPLYAMRTMTCRLHILDAVLVLALALRIHGTDEAIRQTAGRLRGLVPMENRTQMSRLMRCENAMAAVEQMRDGVVAELERINP